MSITNNPRPKQVPLTSAVSLYVTALAGLSVLAALTLAGCAPAHKWEVIGPAQPPIGCEELRRRTGNEKEC
jgi:hypothetical protein